MKLNLIDTDSFIKGKKPVTSSSLMSLSDSSSADSGGLLSEVIFGQIGTQERRTTYSYIDLNTRILHPSIYNILYKLDRRIENVIKGEVKYTIVKGELVEDEKGQTGLKFLYDNMKKLTFRGESEDRDYLIQFIKKEDNNKLFIKYLPVIPAAFRDFMRDEKTGTVDYDPINEIYRKIIKLSQEVQRIKGIADVIKFQVEHKLQLAVDELYIYLRQKISKKEGVIRNNVLGKRVDYSARAVITVDPNIKVGYVGVPEKIVARLYYPFILNFLLYRTNPNTGIPYNTELGEILKTDKISSQLVTKIVTDFYEDNSVSKYNQNSDLVNFLRAVIEDVVKDKTIICKRDPVLHRLSLQAFNIQLVRDNSVHVHPLVTGPFNADFDGDCAYCMLLLYQNGKEFIVHIKDIEDLKFTTEKLQIKTKGDGVVVHDYNVIDDLYIDTINTKTGATEQKKIMKYTKHENLKMYAIEDPNQSFEKFWVSSDHSLIVYDENDKQIKKISPVELLENPNDKYLIQKQKE